MSSRVTETFEELVARVEKAAVGDYTNVINVASVLMIFHEYMEWRDAFKTRE